MEAKVEGMHRYKIQGCRQVQGSGFGAQGLGFGVWGLGI